MTFEELGLIEPICRALVAEGYTTPTPIQEQAIPTALGGRDLLGCAQTGTGKTAAFALPILQILTQPKPGVDFKPGKGIRALVLTPTRELAAQIGDSFRTYGKYLRLKNLVIYGGVSQQKQEIGLRGGVDILVATPGRLLDLMNQRLVNLSSVEFMVLDEADRMLDMGFIQDVRKILSFVPKKRQTMLFSATMPGDIESLAQSVLDNPVRVEVTPTATTVDSIKQMVYYVPKKDKKDLLLHLLADKSVESALVFSRTKHGANKLAQFLHHAGVPSDAIHGNKSQGARQLALSNFKNRKIRVLVATDIAARGIDINELSHVVNFDLPEETESYVHRIGRTGRAGLGGTAISFCDEEGAKLLRDIEKLIGKVIPVIEDHPFQLDPLMHLPPAIKTAQRSYGGGGRNSSAQKNRYYSGQRTRNKR